MHCVVTAGPTFEPLDNVRRLTNFSTGRLGCELAKYLAAQGFTVTLLLGEQAIYRSDEKGHHVENFTTTANLAEQLRALGKKPAGAVFHAAAVSDFQFGKVWAGSPSGPLVEIQSGKYSTRDGTLLAQLVPTPKILPQLRQWFPHALLVGWKYEVDGDRELVMQAARRQLQESFTDACVANGPAYGSGFGLLRSGTAIMHLNDQAALFAALAKLLKP